MDQNARFTTVILQESDVTSRSVSSAPTEHFNRKTCAKSLNSSLPAQASMPARGADALDETLKFANFNLSKASAAVPPILALPGRHCNERQPRAHSRTCRRRFDT